MLILSSSSSRISSPFSSFSTRVPVGVKGAGVSSAATSRLFPISCFAVKSNSVGIRKLRCAVFCDSKVRGMAEMIEDKKESTSSTAAAAAAAMTVSASENYELPQTRAFLDARTGEDLLSAVRKAVEDEKLPLNVAEGMEELYKNYRNAVLQSGVPKADEAILYNMALVLDRVFMDVKDPFVFSPYHKAIREPFDYYKFGQNYIRQLLDFSNNRYQATLFTKARTDGKSHLVFFCLCNNRYQVTLFTKARTDGKESPSVFGLCWDLNLRPYAAQPLHWPLGHTLGCWHALYVLFIPGR